MSAPFLQQLVDREYFGMKLGLTKIRRALKKMGGPQRCYQTIHVAGTNGKGSTATMLARILEKAGYRVGLFSSPHLQSFTERFQINGVPISEERLEALSHSVTQIDSRRHDDRLSFFECMTAVAFQYFAEEKVDVAVIEVGLGGRLDATNVLEPAVTVITPIDYDHQKQLGGTLQAIAREKGGIIKRGVPIVSAPQRVTVQKALQKIAEARKAPLHFVSPAMTLNADGSFSFEDFSRLWLPVLGPGHMVNAGTAIMAARTFASIPREAIYKGLASSYLPGRMEIVRRHPPVILDGAHNPAALSHLAQTVRQSFNCRNLQCLFTTMADKDAAAMLQVLRPLRPQFHFVSLPLKRAMAADRLLRLAKRLHCDGPYYSSPHEAVRTLLSKTGPQHPLLVTGSFFLVGEVRSLLT